MALDTYDYVNIPGNVYLSATSLLKPMRELALKLTHEESSKDIIDRVPSSVGTACHDRLEMAFKSDKLPEIMKSLGYSNDQVLRTKINPSNPIDEDFNIFLEMRAISKINNYSIGGKYDMVIDGQVRDLKTTKVYSYIKAEWENYRIQGSIYKWLNPKLITKNTMKVDFIFTNWLASEAEKNPNYPPQPALSKELDLWSVAETEDWIYKQLMKLDSFRDVLDANLPLCTDEERWKNSDTYAFYANSGSKRASKVSADLSVILALKASKPLGVIETRNSPPKRCEKYCTMSAHCTQYKKVLFM